MKRVRLMEGTVVINKYKHLRLKFFKWEHELDVIYKLILALSFAVFTGLSAQLRIYLPFTPVPITGQVFAVLLAGVVLGKWYGGLSQSLYVGIGALGVPWFADMNGGITYVFGATGGYLVGFIVVAFILGWLTEKHIRARSLTALIPIMLGGVLVIYLFGAVYFHFLLGTTFEETMIKAVLPYIPLDIAKAIMVSFIGFAIIPKTSFNGEVDVAKMKTWKLP
jgi:biotin transport system substrate-specific component